MHGFDGIKSMAVRWSLQEVHGESACNGKSSEKISEFLAPSSSFNSILYKLFGILKHSVPCKNGIEH